MSDQFEDDGYDRMEGRRARARRSRSSRAPAAILLLFACAMAAVVFRQNFGGLVTLYQVGSTQSSAPVTQASASDTVMQPVEELRQTGEGPSGFAATGDGQARCHPAANRVRAGRAKAALATGCRSFRSRQRSLRIQRIGIVFRVQRTGTSRGGSRHCSEKETDTGSSTNTALALKMARQSSSRSSASPPTCLQSQIKPSLAEMTARGRLLHFAFERGREDDVAYVRNLETMHETPPDIGQASTNRRMRLLPCDFGQSFRERCFHSDPRIESQGIVDQRWGDFLHAKSHDVDVGAEMDERDFRLPCGRRCRRGRRAIASQTISAFDFG